MVAETVETLLGDLFIKYEGHLPAANDVRARLLGVLGEVLGDDVTGSTVVGPELKSRIENMLSTQSAVNDLLKKASSYQDTVTARFGHVVSRWAKGVPLHREVGTVVEAAEHIVPTLGILEKFKLFLREKTQTLVDKNPSLQPWGPFLGMLMGIPLMTHGLRGFFDALTGGAKPAKPSIEVRQDADGRMVLESAAPTETQVIPTKARIRNLAFATSEIVIGSTFVIGGLYLGNVTPRGGHRGGIGLG